MSLTLPQHVLVQARQLNDEAKVLIDAGNLLEAEDKVADAWHLLAEAGDTYADDAEKIIREAHQPESIFAKIVDIQWMRFVSQEVKNQNFIKVGQRHQENYLDIIDTDDENRLPDTIQIEASYKESLLEHGLPPLIAIDSIFSKVGCAEVRSASIAKDALRKKTLSASYASWFEGKAHRLDGFTLSSGDRLVETQLYRLIDAMPAFTDDHGGELSLREMPEELAPVVAAWQ